MENGNRKERRRQGVVWWSSYLISNIYLSPIYLVEASFMYLFIFIFILSVFLLFQFYLFTLF